SRGQQRDQEVRAQLRLLVGQRVDQAHGTAAWVVVRQGQLVVLVRTDERVAERLHQARGRERIGDCPTGALTRGQAPARRSGRQDRRDLVVSAQPRDLLDQV